MGQTLSADLIARYVISKKWHGYAYYLLISLRFKSFALADHAFALVNALLLCSCHFRNSSGNLPILH